MIEATTDPSPAALIQRLDQFTDALQTKAVTSGLAAAAKPLKARMKALAPRRGGALAASISHAQLTKTAKQRLGVTEERAVLVGPIRKVADPNYQHARGKKVAQGYKALWAEFGTTAHAIPKKAKLFRHKVPRRIAGTRQYRIKDLGLRLSTPKKRKVLHFGGIFVKSVKHPGARRHPFIAPAYNATHNQVGQAFYEGMARRLDKLARAA